MKVFVYKWVNAIHALELVIVSATTQAKADKQFDEWSKLNPEDAPCAFSPRSYDLGDNKVVHFKNWQDKVTKVII